MQPSEVLAVIRLRQWSYDRARLSAGEVTNYRRQGYRQRRQREADSRIVRVLDFERALVTLPAAEQAALLLVFHEHHARHGVAVTLGCCDPLTWFERHQDVQRAIAREKELKGWRRARKIALIESANPAWADLSRDWYDGEPADYRRALDRMNP